jgi:predicted nucleic acid-binding Zn ribbon protein
MTAPATTPMSPTAEPIRDAEPTHGCVRCGAPVPLDVAMCETCNPLALAQPSSTQVHGIAFLGVGIAVVVLAIVATVAISGVGPFRASIASAVADPPGLNVTLSVTNDGSRAGSTTCRVYDPDLGISVRSAVVQTPRIEPGATITFNRRLTELGQDPGDLAVECRDL